MSNKPEQVRVFNEMPCQINLVGAHREYEFPAAHDGISTMNYVDFSDVEFANSRGNLFKSGMLVFADEENDAIYDALHMPDWKNTVWHEADVIDAIEHPTIEKMQRIVDVNDLVTIERFRGKVVYKMNVGQDVSSKVVSVVEARFDELVSGKVKSAIIVRPIEPEKNENSEKLDALQKELEETRELLRKITLGMSGANAENQDNNDVKESKANKEPVEQVHAPKKKTNATKK